MIKVEKFGHKREIYHSSEPKALVILAHGAGAGNQHEFIKTVATQIAESGFTVSAFNFPYMETAYELDKKRPPNKAPLLLNALDEEIKWLQDNINGNLKIFIVGKSMGGRMATLYVSEHVEHSKLAALVKGVVALGYPFHPPGKVEKLHDRISHFEHMKAPMLVIQGERDTFGNRVLVKQTEALNSINIEWLVDGDHSFKPKKSSPVTESQNIKKGCELAVNFIQTC